MGDERIYPSTVRDENNKKRHFARYEFAKMFIVDGVTLDCACGCGYGSQILASSKNKVIGIDNCNEALEYARLNYKDENIMFNYSDISELSFEKHSFDSVVSLETIEHLDYKLMFTFLERVSEWVKPGGVLICSSPMLRFKDGKPYITNPFHVNEMPKQQLLDVLFHIFSGYEKSFFHQKETKFVPLLEENTGFCIMVARKK